MRIFVPILDLPSRVGPEGASDVQFGGVPKAVPRRPGWPSCTVCGGPMSHIASLLHDGRRLDLRGQGRTLALYQCENEAGSCPVWEAESGANFCAVLSPEDQDEWSGPAPPGAWVYPECRVRRWEEGDDGVSETEYPLHFDQTPSFDSRAVEMSLDDVPKIRLGGTPDWLQRPEVGLGRWTFVAQIDSYWEISGPPPSADEIRCWTKGAGVVTSPSGSPPDEEARVGVVIEESEWYVLGQNVGFGLSYVFLDYSLDPPRGIYLAQR